MLIHARAWLAGALLLGSASAVALDEKAALELALARQPFRAAAEGRIAAAEGEVRAAATLPNPSLALEREHMPGPGGRSNETKLSVAQQFDLSGRRGLARQAAEERLGATRLEQEDARRRLVAEVRQAFAEALHEDAATRAREAWLERLRAAAATVDKLARAGEVAGYARRRVEREMQSVIARGMAAEAERIRARESLAGLVGAAARTELLDGPLIPDAPAPLESLLSKLEARPDLAALRARAGGFDRERAAAERSRIPDLTLGVGGKRVDEPNREDTGIILSLTIPLPLFERGEAPASIAAAQARTIRAEHDLALAKAEAGLRGAWQRAERLRDAALSFRRAVPGGPSELARIAETAYRAGETGILELLDAYRAELEAETTALELELRARLARIELDALAGTQRP